MNPIHYPILPASTDKVKFYLRNIPDVKKATFFESVYEINEKGETIGPIYSKEIVININCASISADYCYLERGPYGNMKFVSYKWQINADNEYYERVVSFCTGTYPLINQPIPVHISGDVNKIFNCVFIPNEGDFVYNESKFIDQVFLFISSIQNNPYLRHYYNTLNFFIHPYTASFSTESGTSHKPPAYDYNISFCNAKCIIHKKTIRDYKGYNNYFSIDAGCESGFIHEFGHCLFHLYDEYPDRGGSHEEDNPYPNNWKTEEKAKEDSLLYFNSENRVSKIDNFFKICFDTCFMNIHENASDFDYPCKDKIYFKTTSYIDRRIRNSRTFLRINENQIKKYCDELQALNLKFNTSYIDDFNHKHIAFNFILSDLDYRIDNSSFSIRPGNIPYHKSFFSPNTLDLFFNINDNLERESFALPLFLLFPDFNLENFANYEFYLPYTPNIKKVHFPFNFKLHNNLPVVESFIEEKKLEINLAETNFSKLF